MKKPYNIASLSSAQDIARLDNLLTMLFSAVQSEIPNRTYSSTGVYITAEEMEEKKLYIVENTTDNVRRLYTKLNNVVRYVNLT